MKGELVETLKTLEETHLNLAVRSQANRLDEILAEGFWEFGSSGLIYDKEHCLQQGVVLSNMILHHYGIQTLASGVVLSTYMVEDTTRNRNTLRSSIWEWKENRWQLSFHQGTITRQTPEEVDFKQLRADER